MSLIWNNGKLIRGRSDEQDTFGLVNELRDKLDAVAAAAFVPSLFTPVAQGEVPASGGGTVNFMRADGSWAAPPVANNPRVFVSKQTGAGPWTFSGLDGDGANLCGYELVVYITKAALAAHTLGVRFNGDSGANYFDSTGGGLTSAPFVNGAFVGIAANEILCGSIFIPVSASGQRRLVNGLVNVADGTPESTLIAKGGGWTSTANITSISVVVETGTVDAGSVRLYKLMDVT